MITEYLCLNKKCGKIQYLEDIDDGESDQYYCSYCSCDSLFEREVDEETFEPLLEIAARNLKRLAEVN